LTLELELRIDIGGIRDANNQYIIPADGVLVFKVVGEGAVGSLTINDQPFDFEKGVPLVADAGYEKYVQVAAGDKIVIDPVPKDIYIYPVKSIPIGSSIKGGTTCR
jgi:hypothetical protein